MKKIATHFSLLVLTLQLSCTASVQEICEERFPTFQAEIQAMAVQIPVPYKAVEGADRSIASVPNTFVSPTSDNISSWKVWSKDRLDEVQKVIDAMEAYPNLLPQKASLTEIANELVMFYGYAERRKWTRMQESIDVILARSEAVKKGVCHESSGAPQRELISEIPGKGTTQP